MTLLRTAINSQPFLWFWQDTGSSRSRMMVSSAKLCASLSGRGQHVTSPLHSLQKLCPLLQFRIGSRSIFLHTEHSKPRWAVLSPPVTKSAIETLDKDDEIETMSEAGPVCWGVAESDIVQQRLLSNNDTVQYVLWKWAAVDGWVDKEFAAGKLQTIRVVKQVLSGQVVAFLKVWVERLDSRCLKSIILSTKHEGWTFRASTVVY
jgi:hypothetical protein